MRHAAIVIRHIHVEDLGTLAPLLQERGFAVRHVDPALDELAAIDAEEPDLPVVPGGPIGAGGGALYPVLAGERALVQRPAAAGDLPGRPVEFDIPPGARHLASTAVGAHQAFAIGDAVPGLQFHLVDRFPVGVAAVPPAR